MQTLSTIEALRQARETCRRQGSTVALVPTMGNLHEGHVALVEAASECADIVIATIFINPLQFGAGEDLEAYPRTLEQDQAKLEAAGCDLLFTPTNEMLYPHGLEAHTKIRVPEVSEGLCGASRPGHFEGVATIVNILFNLVQPDLACFGEKDYQQLAVIRKLVNDLHLPIEIVGTPTVRAEDGLALSSRNGYLDAGQRAQAPELYRTLRQARDSLEGGAPADRVLREALARLAAANFKPDYLELRRTDDLGPVTDASHEAILLVAAHLGPARLIDNIRVALPR
ncbi:pantothenate synthetase [Modicisalibacter ilicicola DSM 19980]|uniref:Pantothenate synthetase n=1 Tax=Modicisalibacter ilicicola DSM 19980 TaxID=1121942 RepID=A0A1M5ALY9_9GAMM|nr:pantoate--beta-alanine ligase [Halomonas ilicicola]SHF31154.1 pantothenate synthetase [Halomonas ilicicola DSM 19980]